MYGSLIPQVAKLRSSVTGMSETSEKSILSGIRASDIRKAGSLLLFGGVEVLLLMTLAEALYPGYSTHTNTISDLAAVGAPTWLFFDPSIFLWGVCWLVGAYFLFRGRKGLMSVNLLPGIGVMLASLSPENVNIVLHSIGAVLAFIPGGVAMMLSYRLIKSPLRYFVVPLGALSLFAVIIYFGAYYSTMVQDTLGSGGSERIIVYPILVWLIAFGSYLLSREKQIGNNVNPK